MTHFPLARAGRLDGLASTLRAGIIVAAFAGLLMLSTLIAGRVIV